MYNRVYITMITMILQAASIILIGILTLEAYRRTKEWFFFLLIV